MLAADASAEEGTAAAKGLAALRGFLKEVRVTSPPTSSTAPAPAPVIASRVHTSAPHLAPPLHTHPTNLLAPRARAIGGCTASAPPQHRLCTAPAPPVHRLCTASAQARLPAAAAAALPGDATPPGEAQAAHQPPERFGEWGWLASRGAPEAVRAVNAAIRAHSSHARLVCMVLPPLPPAGGGAGEATAYVELLHALTAGLPPTLLTASNGTPVITTDI